MGSGPSLAYYIGKVGSLSDGRPRARPHRLALVRFQGCEPILLHRQPGKCSPVHGLPRPFTLASFRRPVNYNFDWRRGRDFEVIIKVFLHAAKHV